jgi:hypothetical protein
MGKTKNNLNQLPKMNDCIRQFIMAVEYFFSRASGLKTEWPTDGAWPQKNSRLIRAELAKIIKSQPNPYLQAHIRLVCDLAITQKQSVVWFVRRYHPIVMMFLLFCEFADSRISKWMDRHNFLTVRELDDMEDFVNQMKNSSLKICYAQQPNVFLNTLKFLESSGKPYVALCDWNLKGKEKKKR